jgi:hypothetical protein
MAYNLKKFLNVPKDCPADTGCAQAAVLPLL